MDLLRDSYKYTYISTQTSTDVTGLVSVPTTCKLIRIVVGETAAGAISIYDALSGATTTTVGVLKASIAEGTYEYGITLSRGLQVVTAGASKITVVWSRV
jgi:hypothetical protein